MMIQVRDVTEKSECSEQLYDNYCYNSQHCWLLWSSVMKQV